MAGNTMPNLAPLTRIYFGNNVVRSTAQVTTYAGGDVTSPEASGLKATLLAAPVSPLNVLGNPQAWAPGSMIGTPGSIGGGPLNVVRRSKAADSMANPAMGPMQPGVSFVSP